jgi:hypothetical protein
MTGSISKLAATHTYLSKNKMLHIHAMEYYSALKRKEILTCAIIWKKLEDILLSEQKKKILYDSICVKPLE